MKAWKKLSVCLLPLVLWIGIMAMPVFAATTAQDGLDVSLTTDKDSYSQGENIKATLSVTNTGDSTISSVSLENLVPEGYKLADGSETDKKVDSLAPGESVTLTTTLTADVSGEAGTTGDTDGQTGETQSGNNSFLPGTGTNNDSVIWIGLTALSACIILAAAVKKKKASGRLLSLFLCLTLAGSLFAGIPSKASAKENNSGSINIENSIIVDGEEMTLKSTVTYDSPTTDPVDDSTINLSASKTEYSISEDGTIYFYAEANCKVEGINLINADTKEVLLKLVDDGKYSESGDDLPGDNIYTAKTQLYTSFENEYQFYAAAADQENLISNTIKVIVYANFTDEQLADMDKVDEMFQTEIFSVDNYDSMTIEERKTIADPIIDKLMAEGLIKSDSVLYDEENQSYTFEYSAGVLGSLSIKKWNSEQNGAVEDAAAERSIEENTYESEENTLTTYAETNALSGENLQIGKALILWSFEQDWDTASYRRPFYASTESSWESNGLDTTVNYNTTVEDYKHLKGYDVIVFSGHGSYDTYKAGFLGTDQITVSSLLLHEKATSSKNSTYTADLKAFRIGKASVQGGTMYAILPSFFINYYDSDDLDGSFVMAENCEFYGKSGNVKSTMASAIRSRSAESVSGFHNSVMANYSRNFMKAYVDKLITGSTTKEAYNAAVASQGANDYFDGREKYGPTAYPIFTGNDNSRLINTGIQNGDLENSSTPVEWNQVGDTRVINKLGSLVPYQNQRMAILTTGIGSAEKDYLSGTEGSVLSQVVVVPEDKKSLMFTYDFVSEEPMEYVGSQYNDTFVVQIVSNSGTETILEDTINTASWYEVSGIDFDGGDSTTYHTNWKSMEYDLSKYAGQKVNIRFMVYDVGDSIYDSAVLLDAVSFQ